MRVEQRVPAEPVLPTGTVTFLFTEIVDSSRLWEEIPDWMRLASARRDEVLRSAVERYRGLVFRGSADGLCAAFPTAAQSLQAAIEAQSEFVRDERTMPEGQLPLRVRMALHTDLAELRLGEYVGPALHRGSRLLELGHGGQVLLSLPTAELLHDALPPGAGLRELGPHRLRDSQRPEEVFQATHPELPAEFPPLRASVVPPNNLPQHVTSFVGRLREITEVRRLLETARLLTLTGAGGTGKTRLSIQIGLDLLAQYPDGVWIVELAPVTDAARVVERVAVTLGVREEPGRPIERVLAEYLAGRRLLLLLDNCEHVLGTTAALADALMRHCPNVRMLATSREALGIGGEQSYQLAPLLLPDLRRLPPLEHLVRYESVRLFTERAVAVVPSFEVGPQNAAAVAELCWRLDGNPLAIELAAARVRSLTVEEINARLDNRFRLLTGGSRAALPRQQTLRALIEWSYDLLTRQERTLLCRLSVFVSGWTLEAAEAVCGSVEVWECGSGGAETATLPHFQTPIHSEDVLDLLSRLVDKSLVLAEQLAGRTRFRLLETIREYARERLLEEGEGRVVQEKHLDFYARLAESAEPHLFNPEQGEWLDRLEQEHDNLTAALGFGLFRADPSARGVRLAGALGPFWTIRSHFAEGRRWLARALQQDGEAPPALRAKVQEAASLLALQHGDASASGTLAEAALPLYRDLDDREAMSRALRLMGYAAAQLGDYPSARRHFGESLDLARALGDRLQTAVTMEALGNAALKEGDFPEARKYLEPALAMRRELGVGGQIASSLLNLACLSRLQGRVAEARALYEESLALGRELGDRALIGWALFDLGLLDLRDSDLERARDLFRESLELWRELGNKVSAVRCLEGMAQLAAVQGEAARAARLFGAAEAQRELLNAPLPPADQADYAALPDLRARLGEQAFEAEWWAGRLMSLEDAYAFVLSGEPEAVAAGR